MGNAGADGVFPAFFEERVAEEPGVPIGLFERLEFVFEQRFDFFALAAPAFKNLKTRIRIIAQMQPLLEFGPDEAVLIIVSFDQVTKFALDGNGGNLAFSIRPLARRT